MKVELQLTIGGSTRNITPASFWLAQNQTTPCDVLRAEWATASCLDQGDFCRLTVDGEEVFYGIVDSQRYTLSAKGGRTQLNARRKLAAYLVDNEAAPKTYLNLPFSQLVARHGTSYGVKGAVGAPDKKMPIYTVPKGRSEWEAISVFCQQLYGRPPYLDGQDRIVADARLSGRAHVLSNKLNPNPGPSQSPSALPTPYSELEVIHRPEAVISSVYLLGEDGAVQRVENEKAGAAVRRRYISPSTQWALFPKWGAREVIASSMERRLEIWIVLPGYFRCSLGDRVTLPDLPSLSGAALTIHEIEWAAHNGVMTRLVLKKE